jgi:hypothetical protein
MTTVANQDLAPHPPAASIHVGHSQILVSQPPPRQVSGRGLCGRMGLNTGGSRIPDSGDASGGEWLAFAGGQLSMSASSALVWVAPWRRITSSAAVGVRPVRVPAHCRCA